MNDLLVIILIILFCIYYKKPIIIENWSWGSFTKPFKHAWDDTKNVFKKGAKIVGQETLKGICYVPGVKQMSNEMIKRVAENRWNNRFTILDCNKKDEMKKNAAEAGTWIAPGEAGHAAHAAHVVYEQEIKKCEHLKNNCKRGPRYALYPNNTSNNLVLQKFSCEWNEENERCNCCAAARLGNRAGRWHGMMHAETRGSNCKNVNNYMLGYESIKPPSETPRLCR